MDIGGIIYEILDNKSGGLLSAGQEAADPGRDRIVCPKDQTEKVDDEAIMIMAITPDRVRDYLLIGRANRIIALPFLNRSRGCLWKHARLQRLGCPPTRGSLAQTGAV